MRMWLEENASNRTRVSVDHFDRGLERPRTRTIVETEYNFKIVEVLINI